VGCPHHFEGLAPQNVCVLAGAVTGRRVHLTVRHGVRFTASVIMRSRDLKWVFGLALTLQLVVPMPSEAAPRRKSSAKVAPSAKGSSKRNAPAASTKLPLPVQTAPAPVAEAAPPPSRGPTRIDFDDRLIQGQSNKSGAVYLYDRKELKVQSMVRRPENFRNEIVDSVYDG
jgi:hypothetical protein